MRKAKKSEESVFYCIQWITFVHIFSYLDDIILYDMREDTKNGMEKENRF